MQGIPIHLRGPCLVNAGYGVSSRQVFEFLQSNDMMIPLLESINWGNCSFRHDLPNQHDYYQAMHNYEQAKQQFEKFPIRLDVSIPQEFFTDAQINIGYTAGAEIDRVSPEFLQKVNEIHALIVPSEHVKSIFEQTKYQLADKESGQDKGELKLETPCFKIPHWFEQPEEIKPLDVEFEADFNFLVVGTWNLRGSFGEDRKDIANTIRFFIDTFKNEPNVGLVLKINAGSNNNQDFELVKSKVEEIKSNYDNVRCKIHLFHDTLTDEEMWGLYAHPKIRALLAMGCEGFNLPALETHSVGKPVIGLNWGGHLDFLRNRHGFIPIDYELKEIPKSMVWPGVLPEGAKWARMLEQDFKKRLRKFYDSPKPIERQAKYNVGWLKENFGKESVMKQWEEFFGRFVQLDPADEEAQEVESDPQVQQYKSQKQQAIDKLSEKVEESDNQKVLYVMPQSIGDVIMSTSIVNALIKSRHDGHDFYFATSKQYYDILSQLVKEYGIKVVEYEDLMMRNEIAREVFDYVYTPGLNVQFNFSNWLNGNGEYAVRLLEEFAKSCNLAPFELADYCLPFEETDIPDEPYVVITTCQDKESKYYKYWDDVIYNVKELLPEISIVQTGHPQEKLFDGVKDFRGKSFAETFYLIKNAYMTISPDTFMQHVAAACGVPSVVLFASTHVNTCLGMNVDGNKPTQFALESEVGCHENKCYKDFCAMKPNGINCLSDIGPKIVCEAVKRLVEKLNKVEEVKDD